MSDHALLALIGGIFGTLQAAGLVVLGLQLREARHDTRELVAQGERQSALLKVTIEHLATLRGQR